MVLWIIGLESKYVQRFACPYVMQSAYIKLNAMVFSLENLLFCSCWLTCLTYERKPAFSIQKCSLDICDAAVVLVVYFPVFIFPCMLDDGHRRLHYIYHCNKDVCSVSHLHTIALKNLIRGWVCVWFSSISFALQVMAVELRLCLALPGITETYCKLCPCVYIKAAALGHAQVRVE